MKRLLVLAGVALGLANADAIILYSNTTETGFRYNTGAAGTTFPADNRRTAYDDTPIPVARLGGFTHARITKVTVGIRRLANAPATDVSIFLTTMTTGPTAPDTEIDIPSTPIGMVSLGVQGAAASTNLVTVGDGVNTLAIMPLNMTLFAGFGTMAVGVNLSSTDSANGWRLTNGPDANANVFWVHDPFLTSQANPEGAYLFSNATPPNPAATFYISVEGEGVVPEPGTIIALGAGLALLAARRRK